MSRIPLSPGVRGTLFYFVLFAAPGGRLPFGFAPLLSRPLAGVRYDGLGPSVVYLVSAGGLVTAAVRDPRKIVRRVRR